MPPYVHLQNSTLDTQSLRRAASGPRSGAVVVFEGCPRDDSKTGKTTGLSYEAYEPMALAMMEELRFAAIGRFSLNACYIHHRMGEVPLGETAIAVVCASAHRAEAFAAAAWLLDGIKGRVPIWKREVWP